MLGIESSIELLFSIDVVFDGFVGKAFNVKASRLDISFIKLSDKTFPQIGNKVSIVFKCFFTGRNYVKT